MSRPNDQQFSSKMLRRMYRRYRMKRRRIERAGAREEARSGGVVTAVDADTGVIEIGASQANAKGGSFGQDCSDDDQEGGDV